ncbi:hypothetical protein NDU88_002484 [Pleurodeles waltl]|uniref:Uncharacterized protein n=1 Tax=Pleurodeles waltl TaxID=8319 RepID=A0AAV7M2K6_PLEWA|nr:hypothetical protein NDU88_002484 [Pleurodeles waltl]
MILEVNILQADVRKVSNKVRVAGGSIPELQMEVTSLQKQMALVNSKSGILEARIEDAKGRSCCNIFWLIGFPEWAEGNAAKSFVKRWIKDVLMLAGLSTMFTIKQAHPVLMAPLGPGARPRTIIVRILNYSARDCILHAQETNTAIFDNHKISIYQDPTNKIQGSWKTFLEVKAKLQDMGVLYMLLYLAHLQPISGGK